MKPQLFAKAGKTSSEKKSVLHPKTSKISNPMAKVFKESADHTDSKSGKAKVDVSFLQYLFENDCVMFFNSNNCSYLLILYSTMHSLMPRQRRAQERVAKWPKQCTQMRR